MASIETPTTTLRRPAGYIARLGEWAINTNLALGDMGVFFLSTLYWIFRWPGRRAISETFAQMYEMGTKSIPVVMIGGGFIGAVLAVETLPQFQEIGLASRVGSIIVISVVKQVGPILTAVMLAGRLGGATESINRSP